LLNQVAQAFSVTDAVYFGRTFRKLTAATQATWRNAAERTNHEAEAISDW